MPTADLKRTAHELIDHLPDNASWDDVVYEMVTRREIEAGLADSEANRTTPVEDVAKEFGPKAMRVHWTDRAKARLRLIHDYIAHDAPLAAPRSSSG